LGIGIFGKRGIFFTFIAVMLMAALIIIFSPSTSINVANKPVVKTRVITLNDFVQDLENSYFESILKVSSHRAILAMASYMQSNNKFLADMQSGFSEAVLQGAINGQSSTIMKNNTLNEWLARMANFSEDTFNVDTQFTVNKVEIYQARPWFVDLRLNISFSVTSETASWEVSNFITNAELSIEDFDDPYYIVNTNGNYIQKINKTDVALDKWNLENVKSHIRYGTYAHFPDSKAPSFLMRFTNTSMASACCGIESLVNPNKLANKDQMESYADYLFFNHSLQGKCTELYNITDAPFRAEFPHFKLDFQHLVFYNISLQNTKRAC